MSPLSIGGGDPHFPTESEKHHLIYRETNSTHRLMQSQYKYSALYNISTFVISGYRNDWLKKFQTYKWGVTLLSSSFHLTEDTCKTMNMFALQSLSVNIGLTNKC
jgi:hypothetical protein